MLISDSVNIVEDAYLNLIEEHYSLIDFLEKINKTDKKESTKDSIERIKNNLKFLEEKKFLIEDLKNYTKSNDVEGIEKVIKKIHSVIFMIKDELEIIVYGGYVENIH